MPSFPDSLLWPSLAFLLLVSAAVALLVWGLRRPARPGAAEDVPGEELEPRLSALDWPQADWHDFSDEHWRANLGAPRSQDWQG
jgi:hypothetical protein